METIGLPAGFAAGIGINALLEGRLRRWSRPVRIGIAIAASLLLATDAGLSTARREHRLGIGAASSFPLRRYSRIELSPCTPTAAGPRSEMAIESGAKRRPPLLLLLAGGALLGALSWLAALGVSGAFEPYDSALGLLANQLVLSLPIALLAFRYRLWTALLCLLGAYVGMNLYTYVFGGAETRAWAVLGAITSVALLVVPAAAAAASAFLSRMCRPPPKDDSAQGRDGS